MAFQAAQGQTVHSGCMVYKDGRFLVQDQTTQEVIELSGPDLAANVGNRVEARGAASSAQPGVAPATSVMNVASVALVAQGGCLSVAAALDAKTEVPAAAAASRQRAAAAGASAGDFSGTRGAHRDVHGRQGRHRGRGRRGRRRRCHGARRQQEAPPASKHDPRVVHTYNGLCPSPRTRLSKQTRTGCSPS